MKDLVEVGPLSRRVMLPSGATPIRPVAGRLSLFPLFLYPQFHQFALRLLTYCQENYGLTVFRMDNKVG